MYEDEAKDANTFNHVKLADEMMVAIRKFSPEEQNEIVKIIYDSVFENRRAKIDEAEKEFIHLKETLKQLKAKRTPIKRTDMKMKCYVCAILSAMGLIIFAIGLGMFLQQFIPWRLLEVVLWFGIYSIVFYKTLMFLLKWGKKNCR